MDDWGLILQLSDSRRRKSEQIQLGKVFRLGRLFAHLLKLMAHYGFGAALEHHLV
jgi:hypothetical protein